MTEVVKEQNMQVEVSNLKLIHNLNFKLKETENNKEAGGDIDLKGADSTTQGQFIFTPIEAMLINKFLSKECGCKLESEEIVLKSLQGPRNVGSRHKVRLIY